MYTPHTADGGNHSTILAFYRTIIGGSCHKYHFCRDKSMLAATKIYFSRQIFLVTNVLSRQEYISRDKRQVTKMILVAAPANNIELTM